MLAVFHYRLAFRLGVAAGGEIKLIAALNELGAMRPRVAGLKALAERHCV